jgi:signal transduction histidine kinase
VSASVGYAVYRLVQEALTNARRHAPGQPVAIAVLGHGDRLRVRVTNPYLAATGQPGSGGGLVGMRERVEALGGTLAAGVEGDLFVVEADLPRGVA